MATTAQGIWFPGPDDPVGRISLEQMAQSMEPGTDYDTGWISLGTSQNYEIRRVGRTVWLYGDNPAISIGSNTTWTNAGLIPSGMRPSRPARLVAMLNGRVGSVLVTGTGDVTIYNFTGDARTTFQTWGSWVIG